MDYLQTIETVKIISSNNTLFLSPSSPPFGKRGTITFVFLGTFVYRKSCKQACSLDEQNRPHKSKEDL